MISDLTVENLVDRLFAGGAQGIGVGELHAQQMPVEFLIRNMECFQRHGVKHIVAEKFFTDLRPELDHFFATGEMMQTLRERVRFLDFEMAISHWDPAMGYKLVGDLANALTDFQRAGLSPRELLAKGLSETDHSTFLRNAQNHPYSFSSLMRKARECGIRFVGADHSLFRPMTATESGMAYDLLHAPALIIDMPRIFAADFKANILSMPGAAT